MKLVKDSKADYRVLVHMNSLDLGKHSCCNVQFQ